MGKHRGNLHGLSLVLAINFMVHSDVAAFSYLDRLWVVSSLRSQWVNQPVGVLSLFFEVVSSSQEGKSMNIEHVLNQHNVVPNMPNQFHLMDWFTPITRGDLS